MGWINFLMEWLKVNIVRIIKREFKVNYILLAENKLFRDGSFGGLRRVSWLGGK